MGLRRTKRNENNATIFHSLACGAAKPTVFLPIRVFLISGYFRRSSPWACGTPRWMKTVGQNAVLPEQNSVLFYIFVGVPHEPTAHQDE